MVTVLVPVVAVPLAFNVSVLLLVAGLGVKDAVTPLGKPLAESVMLPVKPPDGAMLTVTALPCPPLATVTLIGDADRAKLPADAFVTVKVTVVVCMIPPPLPVTVMGYTPATVVGETVIVMVDPPEPGAAIGLGLKPTVTPVGWPVADKATAASKPPEMAAVIVDVPWLPWTTESEAGEAEKVKLGVPGAGARALIKPTPFGLPRPVAKSYPTVAGKPLLPLLMSWNAVL